MVSPVDLDNLASALGVESGELISLVGGGGKTTTLFALGEQLSGTTVLTTTTKMGADQSSGLPTLIDPSDDDLRAQLRDSDRALVWQAADDRRAIGVRPETCDRWMAVADNVVVEADGSRKRPFKAPAAHEPVVPSRTTLLVACIGASAFGRPIADTCHRPDLVAALAKCTIKDDLTPERAAAVLLHPNGSKKDLPPNARFVVALHRVATADLAVLEELAALLAGHASLIAVKDRARQ